MARRVLPAAAGLAAALLAGLPTLRGKTMYYVPIARNAPQFATTPTALTSTTSTRTGLPSTRLIRAAGLSGNNAVYLRYGKGKKMSHRSPAPFRLAQSLIRGCTGDAR